MRWKSKYPLHLQIEKNRKCKHIFMVSLKHFSTFHPDYEEGGFVSDNFE